MKDLIVELFGQYVPNTYLTVNGEATLDVIAPGAAGVDWVWIAGVVLFAITLYGILRIIGGLFNK